jgi:hypothetical protein
MLIAAVTSSVMMVDMYVAFIELDTLVKTVQFGSKLDAHFINPREWERANKT